MDIFDTNLVAKLRAIQKEAQELKASLYSSHGNCACSDSGVCAHHAITNNFLLDISEAAEMAQSNILHEWGKDLPSNQYVNFRPTKRDIP